jgi:DNA-binding NarL/FixJ family response regulator
MEPDRQPPIRVAIHASDTITYSGLSSLVQQQAGLTEVSGDTARSDVVVVSVDNGSVSMMELLDQLSPDRDARFLIIVEKNWQADIFTAVERGVRSVMWRTQMTPTVFLQALVTVGNGGGYFPSSLQGTLMEQVQQTYQRVLKPLSLTPSGMTDREIDVLRLLAEGFGIEEIAEKLSYSERTVKNILHKVIKRFNFRNRTQAVSYAIRSGLL